jgi:transposase
MPIFEEGWRFYGVDLSAVPGVGSAVPGTFMSELGTGTQIKSAFRSAEAFASWLGLCPDNRVSGGKVLKAKTRKVVSRVAAALRIAAQSLRNSEHKLGEYCRRMKARLGKAEGITATAHKLARILYAVITRRVTYHEEEAFKQTPATQARRIHNLQKQAAKLGLQLIPAT